MTYADQEAEDPRLVAERDGWKARAEKAEASMRDLAPYVERLLKVIRASDHLLSVLGKGAREDLAWRDYREARAKLETAP